MNLKMESSELEFQELQKKRIKEIMEAREKIKTETVTKAKKLQYYYILVELALSIVGYLIIGFTVSWWLVLGLFFIQWGSNMTRQRVIYQNKKNIWSEIWKL